MAQPPAVLPATKQAAMASSVLSVVPSWDLLLKTSPKTKGRSIITARSQAKADTVKVGTVRVAPAKVVWAASSGRTEQSLGYGA